MDYRIYHAINQFVYDHAWLGRGLSALESWAVPAIAIATPALWLLARPGGSRKWKLASAHALGSAALALLINQLIGKIWHRHGPSPRIHPLTSGAAAPTTPPSQATTQAPPSRSPSPSSSSTASPVPSSSPQHSSSAPAASSSEPTTPPTSWPTASSVSALRSFSRE